MNVVRREEQASISKARHSLAHPEDYPGGPFCEEDMQRLTRDSHTEENHVRRHQLGCCPQVKERALRRASRTGRRGGWKRSHRVRRAPQGYMDNYFPGNLKSAL